ncbi:MAG: hypothetical protein E7173_02240 [Firmicutes bacterium]|nr:hypothetical protein [Bacillota bacterium]
MGLIFKWKIEKILVLPFGGLTIFQECINRPIMEEFLVCIAGPIFQIIYYFLTLSFWNISSIHYSLLIFNLLPIVPLDGSKLLNLLFSKFFSFYVSMKLTNIVSLIVMFIFLIYTVFTHNLMLLLTMIFLLIKTIDNVKILDYVFNRFLLERYMNISNFHKIKKVYNLNLKKMRRDYKHIFYYQKKSYTEKEIIRKRFDLQGKVW